MSGHLRVVAPSEVRKLSLDPVDDTTRAQAAEILTDVRENGEAGLRRRALALKDIESEDTPLVVSAAELKAAFDALPEDQQSLLQRSADRIRSFAEAQRASITEMETPVPGGMAGQSIAPVAVAGCYAPGGRYPLPSSVLMTAVTARVAGVKLVVVASPRPTEVTLAAAHVAGADILLRVGGAQAIGAMAYGIESGSVQTHVPACDVIVGPGNRWVTAAKQMVSGRVAIDMLAGPSECLVLADATADPAVIAADLLAQAEHDTDALPILITVQDPTMGDRVNAELEKQLETLSTADVARVAVSKGFVVNLPTLDAAIDMCDVLAPEHLEVMTADADVVGKRLKNYGGLFVGTRSAEVFGDYAAGPNHVLPTSGTARYTGGLSVFTFLRMRTWLRIDDAEASQGLVRDAAQLARLEGLEGHARSAEARLLK
jgi:histidinol dehydrogenase